MSKTLTFEQAQQLVERGVLGIQTNHICLHRLSRNDLDEWYIQKVAVNRTKNQYLFDVVKLNTPVLHNRVPCWIPHTMIKSIAGMSIEKVLEAYEMSETNRVEEIDIETDVVNDVIGKESAIIDGFEIAEGKRFIFLNDKTPNYNNRIFTVKMENDRIKLVANRGRPKKIRE